MGRPSIRTLSLAVALMVGTPAVTNAQAPATTDQIDENVAYAIGMEAVFYGLAPVLMQIGIQSQTDADKPYDNGQAPTNQMGHARRLYGPDDKFVVTANNDTLYSFAGLDLSKEPMVLTIPDTNGRYYIMQLLDAYSRAIDDVGIGTLGAKGGTFAIVGPAWKGTLPPEMVQIRSPTPQVYIIGRTGVDGDADLPAARAMQDRYQLTSLSNYGKPPAKVELGHKAASAKPAFPEGLNFFSVVDTAMRRNPLPDDAPVTDQFKRIGMGLDKPFDAASLSEPTKRGMTRALKDGMAAVQRVAADSGSRVNGWNMEFKGGEYGNDYLLRSAIGFKQLGLNKALRALYPNRYIDADNKPLNGQNAYTIKFDGTVPVKAFWSLTMYDAKELYMVENAIKRYSIGDRTKGLKTAPDGSLTLYIQAKSPGPDKEANWLPAPNGDFFLQMRLYEPAEQVLSGSYRLPQVTRVDGR
ncbi:MAG TPA: DUF1254 domain-containing protein [Ensifer sp.]|jgi:hypothetical protein|uniref:DUF1254 domain-containing protein n=1 Tax=Ensifer sp. TaxID=1872086 RepID=UPI002E1338AA|nr:DUF1254 domain-containing protein [Ensifer sp.]